MQNDPSHGHPIALAVLVGLAASAVTGVAFAIGLGILVSKSLDETARAVQLAAQANISETPTGIIPVPAPEQPAHPAAKPTEPILPPPAVTVSGKTVRIAPATEAGVHFALTELERDANFWDIASEAACADSMELLQQKGSVFMSSADLRAKPAGVGGAFFNGNKDQAHAFIDRLEQALGSNAALHRLCRGLQGIYAVTFSGNENFGITLFPHDGSAAKKMTFAKAPQVMDYFYQFVPDAIAGQALLRTGYGDAGHTWWNYDLAKSTAFVRAESCHGQFIEDGTSVGAFEYSCEMSYSSR